VFREERTPRLVIALVPSVARTAIESGDAAALGGEWALERVESFVDGGASANRQLRLVRHGHRLADVLRGFAETIRA